MCLEPDKVNQDSLEQSRWLQNFICTAAKRKHKQRELPEYVTVRFVLSNDAES